MLPGKELLAASAAFIAPDDLVQEAFPAENPVAENPGLGAHPPVQMQAEHALRPQELPAHGDHPAQQAQVALLVGKLVLIGRQAQARGALPPSLFPQRALPFEASAGHEGGIQIHALHLARERPDLLREPLDAAADQKVGALSVHSPVHRNLPIHFCSSLPPGFPGIALMPELSGVFPAPERSPEQVPPLRIPPAESSGFPLLPPSYTRFYDGYRSPCPAPRRRAF